jgi:hypothetical protein
MDWLLERRRDGTITSSTFSVHIKRYMSWPNNLCVEFKDSYISTDARTDHEFHDTSHGSMLLILSVATKG